MAKIKLTRPELKRQRDALERFLHYLPMLKLKQQQLQLMMRDISEQIRQGRGKLSAARDKFNPYRPILSDVAGVNLHVLSEPSDVETISRNVAGVRVPVFQRCVFPEAAYSLFSTPAWVDKTLSDMKNINALQAELDVRIHQRELIEKELTKIIQRVNMFEKVKIPQSREAIRRIRIHLGDEMTAAVGRAKIAKSKIQKSEATVYGGSKIIEETQAS